MPEKKKNNRLSVNTKWTFLGLRLRGGRGLAQTGVKMHEREEGMFLLASGADYSEWLFGFSIQSSRGRIKIISQLVQVDCRGRNWKHDIDTKDILRAGSNGHENA